MIDFEQANLARCRPSQFFFESMQSSEKNLVSGFIAVEILYKSFGRMCKTLGRCQDEQVNHLDKIIGISLMSPLLNLNEFLTLFCAHY